MRPICVALLSGLSLACIATPSGPADQVASDIVAALDAGQDQEAASLWDRAAPAKDYREKIYPVLFQTARDRSEHGDNTGSVAILRFMEPRYPDALAVLHALLRGLFIQRGQEVSPDPDLLNDVDRVLSELRSREADELFWVDLVQAQQAIDQGRLTEAREAFGRFLENWAGEPSTLMVYVEDIDRYLSSHERPPPPPGSSQ